MAKQNSKKRCSKKVSADSMAPIYYRCRRNPTIKEKGEWWCWQHAPSVVEKRRDKRDAKWEVESKEQDLKWALQEKVERATDRVVSLCRDLVRNLDDKCPKDCISEGHELIRKELKKIDKANQGLERLHDKNP